MSRKTIPMMMIAAAALSLAACQHQAGKPAQQPAPQATGVQPAAPAPKPTQSAAMTAKPAAPAPAPAPKPAPKPVATAAPKPAPKPATAAPAPAPTPKPAAPKPAPKPVAMAPMNPFNTNKCAACHAIDHDKVGPAWKTVVEKYGDAATLARDFESGFKERRVANSIAKWKPKEGLMTSQFNNLIKGHEKEAAHALFESVKQGKFGSY